MPAHGLAPQNLSSDKHVDVCVDSDEDRGSTPLASSPESFRGCHAAALAWADFALLYFLRCLKDYGLAGQPCSRIMLDEVAS